MTDIYHDSAMGVTAEHPGLTHSVQLTWFAPNGNDVLGNKHHLPMSINDARSLLDHLAQSIRRAEDQRFDDARRGPCSTCGGIRMIDVPRPNGRDTWREHCPDCPPADVFEFKAPQRAAGSESV